MGCCCGKKKKKDNQDEQQSSVSHASGSPNPPPPHPGQAATVQVYYCEQPTPNQVVQQPAGTSTQTPTAPQAGSQPGAQAGSQPTQLQRCYVQQQPAGYYQQPYGQPQYGYGPYPQQQYGYGPYPPQYQYVYYAPPPQQRGYNQSSGNSGMMTGAAVGFLGGFLLADALDDGGLI